MAKRREPKGDKPKRKKPAKPRAGTPPFPDRRALEASMHDITRSLQGRSATADTPLDKAQEVMYRAFAEDDRRRRTQLAREALLLSPDCADAYVLLAEHAPSRKEALRLYEQGVAAGERALGPKAFQEYAGHFWGVLETRPYMRARLGLALALWTAGRRDEAVQHAQDMLRLNPNDNQGVRDTLAGFLLSLDRDDDLARLLEQYPEEGSASWAYTRALLAFRRQGDTPETRALLKEATKRNKHVPDYLLGRKFPPANQPDSYGFGDDNEALIYVGGFLAGWKSTPGAIAWLRANDDKTIKHKAKAPSAKGPLSVIKKWLNEHLPQAEDAWQADFRQLATWVKSAGDKVRPWMILVTSGSDDLVLAHQVAEAEPSSALLWDALVQAMQNPVAGEPHRPTRLQVLPREPWESLRPHLGQVGIELLVSEELDEMETVFQGLAEHLGAKPEPGLLDVPGMKREQVGAFYEAAAYFYQQAPWKKVGYESAIKIECAKFHSGPWYGVLMGQSGLTMGLALYEDLDLLKKLWAGTLGERENARQTVATTVTFGAADDMPLADLEAARRHGWKVARPDAYPSVFHKERGLAGRPPLAWELELMEGCLRAIPDFVDRRKQDDPTRDEVTVPLASGELPLALAWVVED